MYTKCLIKSNPGMNIYKVFDVIFLRMYERCLIKSNTFVDGNVYKVFDRMQDVRYTYVQKVFDEMIKRVYKVFDEMYV